MTMTKVEFLRPHLRGNRFEGAAVPLEVLKDLAVIEEMVIEVARWRFLQDHPDRRRCPRGFTDAIALRLTGVEPGSAILPIDMWIDSLNLPGVPTQSQEYFEQAREAIVQAIEAAEQNRQVTSLPEKCLGYFDRIGRSLLEEEAIEFSTPSRSAPARLTRETRRRLLVSSRVRELTEDVTLRGLIPEADQDAMTFTLQLFDGHKIPGPMPDQHLDTIIEAFKDYRHGARVLLQGIGKYNRQNRLLRLESVQHIALLAPLDISARLDELRELKDGWFEGKGVAPSPDGLNWLAALFDRVFPDDLPLPYLYPTAEGGIQAEWSISSKELSLEVDLSAHRGAWHWLDLDTDEDDSRELDLNDAAAFEWIIAEIRGMVGGEE
jgi:hypothetical protein